MQKSYVYILASKRNGRLYIGITSNLAGRIFKHKEGSYEGFTKKYLVNKLEYFEEFHNIREAISREKQLKKWKRSWKLKLIEEENQTWTDLYYSLVGFLPSQE